MPRQRLLLALLLIPLCSLASEPRKAPDPKSVRSSPERAFVGGQKFLGYVPRPSARSAESVYARALELEESGDGAAALPLYRRAAQSGDAQARTSLGSIYLEGRLVPADPEEAVYWLKLAAAAGEPQANYNLGVLSAEGRIMPRDPAQAIAYYQAAAAAGYLKAQVNLAVLLSERAQGDDIEQAYRWALIAARQGDQIAGAQRDALVQQVDPQARSRAETLAARWTETAAH